MGLALLVMALTMANYSCSERYLRTESVTPGKITGIYTLILYGGNYGNDIKTVAILEKEGTPYTFDIFAPAFDYRVIKKTERGIGVKSFQAVEKLLQKTVQSHLRK